MKQMTCAQMGGPDSCKVVITGSSSKEMIDNGNAHLAKMHPKMAEDMKTMTKETGDTWRAEFQKKWDAAPAI